MAEVVSEEIIINNIDDGVNLLGELYYQNVDAIILYEKNVIPDFFDLKTGMAGEILQKFSNYRLQLAIVGDFSKISSKSLQNFIYECNRGKQTFFANSLEEAMQALTH
jgi:hypothetical protein